MPGDSVTDEVLSTSKGLSDFEPESRITSALDVHYKEHVTKRRTASDLGLIGYPERSEHCASPERPEPNEQVDYWKLFMDKDEARDVSFLSIGEP